MITLGSAAAIVKIDDAGFYLNQRPSPAAKKIGAASDINCHFTPRIISTNNLEQEKIPAKTISEGIEQLNISEFS